MMIATPIVTSNALNHIVPSSPTKFRNRFTRISAPMRTWLTEPELISEMPSS
jgi:hypothetical protein